MSTSSRSSNSCSMLAGNLNCLDSTFRSCFINSVFIDTSRMCLLLTSYI